MITAIDTNILLDILAPDPEFLDESVAALEEAARAGSMIICDQVYAELLGVLTASRAASGPAFWLIF